MAYAFARMRFGPASWARAAGRLTDAADRAGHPAVSASGLLGHSRDPPRADDRLRRDRDAVLRVEHAGGLSVRAARTGGGGLHRRGVVRHRLCQGDPALALPAIGLAAFVAFLGAYSEFALGWMFVDRADNVTLAMGLWNAISLAGNDWNFMAAYALMMSVPVVVVFVLLQRYLVDGLLAGEVELEYPSMTRACLVRRRHRRLCRAVHGHPGPGGAGGSWSMVPDSTRHDAPARVFPGVMRNVVAPGAPARLS